MRRGGADYRDDARPEHMFRSIKRIQSHLPSITHDSLHEGDDATEIILYNIQMIGEDANNISDALCAAHPEIDFAGWAGIRHRLMHDYANIDFDIVWDALITDLPKLEAALKPMVDALPKEVLPANLSDFE